MSAHRLELEGVTIAIGGRVLVPALSLALADGAVATVMGPSGSGKSSLLAFLCGMLPAPFAAGGRIRADGEDVTARPPERRGFGILFQDDLLFPHLSVGDNLAFGLPPHVRGRAARRARIEDALAQADLAGFADRDPATLSGGQRARAALMRSLLAEPRALLLDEPFAKLDLALRARFRAFVLEHARARRLPTILVTHDPADAEAAGGTVVRLGRGAADEAEERPLPVLRPLPGKA